MKKKINKKRKKRKFLKKEKQLRIELSRKNELEAKIFDLHLILNNNNSTLDLKSVEKMVNDVKCLIDLTEIESLISEAFRAFAQILTGDLELKFLKDCMYALGLCFTENEFNRIRNALMPQSENYLTSPVKIFKKKSSKNLITEVERGVNFKDFCTLMTAILICGLYSLSSEDTLIKAFECLADNSENNLKEWIEMENILVLSGEKFNDDEIYSM